jgi:plastocyanin
MRAKVVLGTVGTLSLIGAAACGGESPGATMSTTTGTGGATGPGGSGTATIVNGCDPSSAEDQTGENLVMIMFGGSLGDAYSPACVKVAQGSGVMFMGDLAAHPLAGGVGGDADAASPIKETRTGMMVTFHALPAGTFGFFCESHDAAGMHGALFVE